MWRASSSGMSSRASPTSSSNRSSETSITGASPDPDALVGIEPEAVARRGGERRVELVEVAHDVGAELRRAVRIDGEVLLLLLDPSLGAPDVGPVEEQPLRAGEAVDHGQRLVAEVDEVGGVGDGEAPEVADVLADGQRAVDVLTREVAGLEPVVLRDERL